MDLPVAIEPVRPIRSMVTEGGISASYIMDARMLGKVSYLGGMERGPLRHTGRGTMKAYCLKSLERREYVDQSRNVS